MISPADDTELLTTRIQFQKDMKDVVDNSRLIYCIAIASSSILFTSLQVYSIVQYEQYVQYEYVLRIDE